MKVKIETGSFLKLRPRNYRMSFLPYSLFEMSQGLYKFKGREVQSLISGGVENSHNRQAGSRD